MPDDEPPAQTAGYLRVSVGLVSGFAATVLLVIAAFLTWLESLFKEHGRDNYLVAGAWLGFTYFAGVFVTCRRNFPASSLYFWGVPLHFLVAPSSLGLVGWFSIRNPGSNPEMWVALVCVWLPLVLGWFMMAHGVNRSAR